MELKYIMENIIREFNYNTKPYDELLKELEELKKIHGDNVIRNYLLDIPKIPELKVKISNSEHIPHGIASIDVIGNRIRISEKSIPNIEHVLNHEYMHKILFDIGVGNLYYDNLYDKNEYL